MTNNEVFTPIDYIKRLDKKFNSIHGPILDNCCGEGVWLKYAQDKGYSVWGCDISKENCIKTIKNLYGDGDIEYITGKDIPKIMKGPGLKGVFKLNDKLITNIVCADSYKYEMNFNHEKQTIKFGHGLFEI